MITQTLSYHTLPELLAGGPGSGCRGPNCGRPSGRGVAKQYQTTKGFTYTILKPSRKGIPRGPSAFKKRYSMKGMFKRTLPEDVAGREGRKSRVAGVYDAKWGKKDVWAGQGVTVIVHRDFARGRMVIEEATHDEMNKTDSMKVFKFKNFGQGAGFLNSRYGIRQKLPRQGQ